MSQRHATACRAGARALTKLVPDNPATEILLDLATRLEQPKPASAKAPMSEWASMKAEITRKALETIAVNQTRAAQGVIGERELWCIADALYDATSGLVDPDISALLYAARQELKEHAPQ